MASDDTTTATTTPRETPPDGMRTFLQVLVNTAVANVTTSFLWFALVFWVYLETRSVLATGIIGGAYMLFIAMFSMAFGTIVDRHRKHLVMIFAGVVTLVAFSLSGGIFLVVPESSLLNIGNPMLWAFSGIILFGAVIENMRNIALSTTVTLLIPEERHANANGLVGTVQGLAFLVTSVFSGLSIGLLGMGWTLVIAIVLSAAALVHLLFLRIPEEPRSRTARSARSSTCAAASRPCAPRPDSSRSSSSRRSTTSSAASTWRSWTRTGSSCSRSRSGASCWAWHPAASSSAAC